MTKNDIVVKFFDSEKEDLRDKNFAYFGWEGGEDIAFLLMAKSYKDAAETIYAKMTEQVATHSDVDSLIYPLCFLWRQSIELILKGCAFGLVLNTDDKKKQLLNKGHNLELIWSMVQPAFSFGKNHVGSNSDISAMEHYVKELNQFDMNSMRMRYPIDKNLNQQNEYRRLDYLNFNNCMFELYSSISQIFYDIKPQITNVSPKNDIFEFIEIYRIEHENIDFYIQSIGKLIVEECNKNELGVSVFCDNWEQSLDMGEQNESAFESLSWNAKILVEVLYYAVRQYKQHVVVYSQSPYQRIDEFVTVCLDLMLKENLKFGFESQNFFNVISKQHTEIKSCLRSALQILDFEGEKNENKNTKP